MIKDERPFVLASLCNCLQMLLGSCQHTGQTSADRRTLYQVSFGCNQKDYRCVTILQDKLHVRPDAGEVFVVQSRLILEFGSWEADEEDTFLLHEDRTARCILRVPAKVHK